MATSVEAEEILRTSAALAAAAFGSALSPGACGFLPSVRPACGALIFPDGAAALAFPDRAGAFVGCAFKVRPSPLKLPLSLPQQLPMVLA
jgi:hypothetical protein